MRRQLAMTSWPQLVAISTMGVANLARPEKSQSEGVVVIEFGQARWVRGCTRYIKTKVIACQPQLLLRHFVISCCIIEIVMNSAVD